MSSLNFASRNQKEILRDPLSLVFGFGLPIVLLFLFSIMQQNMPYDLFQIEQLAPGIIVFGFSFLTLFSGMLLGKDRGSSFLLRLFASPLGCEGLYYWLSSSNATDCFVTNRCWFSRRKLLGTVF